MSKVGNICFQIVYDNYYSILLFKIALSLLSDKSKLFYVCSRSSNDAIGFFTIKSLILRSTFFIGLVRARFLKKLTLRLSGYKSKSLHNLFLFPIYLIYGVIYYIHINVIYKGRVAEYTIMDVKVGDLLIDSFIRFRPAKRLNSRSIFVVLLLSQTAYDIKYLRRFFTSNHIKIYCSSYASYLNHGLPVRIALQLGIKVITFGSLNKFANELSPRYPFHSLNRSTVSRREDLTAKALENAREQIESRLFRADMRDMPYMKYMPINQVPSEITYLDLTDAVVIFLHDFTDSYHIYDNLIYECFWDWAIDTIDCLIDSNVKFFLKPHPNQNEYSEDIFKQLDCRYKTAITVLSKDYTTSVIANGNIRCGITVYGTVAHELAYLGVPTLIAAYGQPYIDFRFAINFNNKNDYRSRLRSTDHIARSYDSHIFRYDALRYYIASDQFASVEEKTRFLHVWQFFSMSYSSDKQLLNSALDELDSLLNCESWNALQERIT
ncbi:hypothetical protein QWJ17_00215 [Betaproteobacteria bacterium LSUCC0117]|nr:hypothetical protein [Betaproteobacteria bacterium LSUCC0117]